MSDVRLAMEWILTQLRKGELAHRVWDDAKARYSTIHRTDLLDAYLGAERQFDLEKRGEEITVPIPASLLTAALSETSKTEKERTHR